jgi:MinD-like ATPase involved in chromosome partitioning or flagellar assembly
MEYKRITMLCGHYGSGKTNIALNMAYSLKETKENVAIADLDIVNPYFRTKDSEAELKEKGIRLIASEYAGTNVDIPALPQDMYSLTDDKNVYAVIDVGGDDRGALALGRIMPSIKEENDYEIFLVINKYRPLTPDVESTLEVMAEIETAGNFKFTGIINNSNLGVLTTAEDVLNSAEYAEGVVKSTGLPLAYTSVNETLYNELEGKIDNLFSLKLQKKIN